MNEYIDRMTEKLHKSSFVECLYIYHYAPFYLQKFHLKMLLQFYLFIWFHC